MNRLGKLKLQIIPDEIARDHYSYHAQKNAEGSKFPSYETFFQECVNICEEKNIYLKSKWIWFFNECKELRIDPKKEPCTIQAKPEEWQQREIAPYTEEDFWKVERDVVSQPEKWKILGYIKNPWANFMLTLPTYEYMELYLLYLNAHPVTEPEPLSDELVKYHAKLREVFNT